MASSTDRTSVGVVAHGANTGVQPNNAPTTPSSVLRRPDLDQPPRPRRQVHFLDDPVPIPPHRNLITSSASSSTQSRLRQRRAERAARLNPLSRPTAATRDLRRLQPQPLTDLFIPSFLLETDRLFPCPGQNCGEGQLFSFGLQDLRHPLFGVEGARTTSYPQVPSTLSEPRLNATSAPSSSQVSSRRTSTPQGPPPAYPAVDPVVLSATEAGEREAEVARLLKEARRSILKGFHDVKKAQGLLSGRNRGAL